jgi:Domain of unknown function (DUF4279)
MSFDTYAYFFVREFEGDAEQISELLQLEPTETWHKNEISAQGHPREFSNWKLQSPLPRTEIFQDSHLLAILDILEQKRELVLQVISTFECGLQCVGYYASEHPGFHMDSQLISRIAAFGLSVDFDLYCWCDHE